MSVYKRKGSPYWTYDFTFKGGRFRGSSGTSRKADAKTLEAKVRAKALSESIDGTREQHTLGEAFARYLIEHASRLPSVNNITYQSKNIVRSMGKNTPLSKVTDSEVAKYVAKRRAKVADSSVNRELTLLRSVLRMAARKWKWEVAVPDWAAHWLTEPEPRDRYLTANEFTRLMDELADHIRPMVLFSVLTGVRLSNCVNLDWSQVDMGARQMSFRVKSRKDGGKVHALPITGQLLVLLANQGPKDAGPVFTYKGKAIKSPKKGFTRACARAGLANMRWHDLRHTAATWMVQAGVPLDAVQDTLGHESIETTRRYAHRQDEAKLLAMNAVDSIIRGQKSPAVKSVRLKNA